MAVFALVLSLPHGQADIFGKDFSHIPIAESGTMSGDGYVSAKFTTDGAGLAFTVRAQVRSLPAAIGWVAYDSSNLSVLVGANTIEWTGSEWGAQAGVAGAEVGDSEYVHSSRNPIFPVELHEGGDTAVPGNYTIVLWWAGDADWNWTLRAEEGASVEAFSTGNSSFMLRHKDFEGALSVRLHAGETVSFIPNATAQVNVSQRLIMDAPPVNSVSGNCTPDTPQVPDDYWPACFGHASQNRAWENGLSLTLPDGRTGNCPCSLYSPVGPNQGPGTYVFHLDTTEQPDFPDIENVVFGVIDPVLHV